MNAEKKKGSSHAFGRVSEDPIKSLPTNHAISFIHKPVKGLIQKGSTTIRNWEFFQGALLHIAFTKPDQHMIEGSGVLVAPGIAYCATHVISPHIENIMNGSVIASCFGITDEGIQIWSIKAVTISDGSDISILALEYRSNLPKNNSFVLSQITTRTPEIGEELMICGFKADKQVFKASRYGVAVGGAVWISKGSVIDTYPTGRDKAMIPWPSLAIDVSSTGGMSGGPVYDKNGSLVGLLCSSIEDDVNGVSYVSLVWPSLVSRFKGHWPQGLYKDEMSLLELPKGLCKIDKPEAIIHIADESNSHAYYKLWH